MKLCNSVTFCDWKYGDRVWSIPENEEEGYLSVVDTTVVLGVIEGNEVTLQPKKEVIDNANQMWIRRMIESNTAGINVWVDH